MFGDTLFMMHEIKFDLLNATNVGFADKGIGAPAAG